MAHAGCASSRDRSRRRRSLADASEAAHARKSSAVDRASRRRRRRHARARISRPGRARHSAHPEPRRGRPECDVGRFLGRAGPGAHRRTAGGGPLLRCATILDHGGRFRLLEDARRSAASVGSRPVARRRRPRGAHDAAAGDNLGLRRWAHRWPRASRRCRADRAGSFRGGGRPEDVSGADSRRAAALVACEDVRPRAHFPHQR